MNQREILGVLSKWLNGACELGNFRNIADLLSFLLMLL